MGQPKQLLEVEGETLIERSIRIALAAGFDKVDVVLGANADLIAPVIEGKGARILINPDWEEGMGSSIRHGIQNLSEADAVMILLVDQPAVTSDWLSGLREAFEHTNAEVVTTTNNGISSPPAIFDKSLFPRLIELRGDQGAKKLLAEAQVEKLEFPGLLKDLDCPKDLEP